MPHSRPQPPGTVVLEGELGHTGMGCRVNHTLDFEDLIRKKSTFLTFYIDYMLK